MSWKSLALLSVFILVASAAAHTGSLNSPRRAGIAVAYQAAACAKSSARDRAPSWVQRLKAAQCQWRQRSQSRGTGMIENRPKALPDRVRSGVPGGDVATAP